MKIPEMPPWCDLAQVPARVNALMAQNWDLLNEAIRLINAGDMSPLAWAQLQDIWAESIDIETKLSKARAPELDGASGWA